MAAIADLLRLLGDATRMRLLHLLRREPLTVRELQQVLDLSQSSVSGHLAKLKQAGYLHEVAEGSARRYRLREDLAPVAAQTWQAVRDLSQDEAEVRSDQERLQRLRAGGDATWVDRVAGSLHRAYAPGRTWEALGHGLLHYADFGICADIGAGDGAMIELLAPRACELICVDPAPAMIAAGKRRIAKAELRTVRYVRSSGEDLRLADDSCDSVLFLQSLQYINEPARALVQARRILRQGGRILVVTLCQHDFDEARRYGHRHFGFTEEQLATWMTGLKDIDIYPLAPEHGTLPFRSLVATGRS